MLQIHEPGQTPEPHATTRAIGIDLGTTHSVAAVLHHGHPVEIEDGEGRSLVPSIVAADGDAVRVGVPACEMAGALSSIKRMMGRGIEDTERLAPHLLPYLVDRGDGLPRFRLGAEAKTPMEISALILHALKRQAEEALDDEVGQAVVTVPAYFDDAARLATRDAARLAGLEVLRLVNEPTAAALSYGLEHGAEGIYAIYDLGGGTFDFSLLMLEKGVFQVLSTAGDTALGGDDIDLALAAELAVDPREARRIKERLSDEPAVGGFSAGQLSRLADPFIRRTLAVCDQAMGDAGVSREQLQGIVLVGGSTRLQAVREAVELHFGRPPLTSLDPDRVVAYGAAIQAGQLTEGGDHLLLDVIPLSLGLETMGDLAEKLIHRNSPIPTTATQEFTTFKDGQSGLMIHVIQGEREMASQCRSLARFELGGIPPMPAGMARIRVIFQVDADGLLTVSAEETTTGVSTEVAVRPSYGLPFEEIEQMIVESMENAREDIAARLLAEAKVEADRLIHDLESALSDDGDLLDAGERARIENGIAALRFAVKGGSRDAIDVASADLQALAGPFAQKRMDSAIGAALKGSNIDSIA